MAEFFNLKSRNEIKFKSNNAKNHIIEKEKEKIIKIPRYNTKE